MSNPDKANEGLLGGIGDISKSLTDLMKDISGTIKGVLDDILVKLGLKKQEDILNQVDKTKLDLNQLKDDINLQKDDIKNIDELSEQEKKIIQNLIDKNQDIKNITDWIKTEFGEERQKIEFGEILLNLSTQTDGNEIEQSELDSTINILKEDKEKIDKDEILKDIIKNTTKDDTNNSLSINKIIAAYETIKTEKELVKNTTPITKDDILSKINGV